MTFLQQRQAPVTLPAKISLNRVAGVGSCHPTCQSISGQNSRGRLLSPYLPKYLWPEQQGQAPVTLPAKVSLSRVAGEGRCHPIRPVSTVVVLISCIFKTWRLIIRGLIHEDELTVSQDFNLWFCNRSHLKSRLHDELKMLYTGSDKVE